MAGRRSDESRDGVELTNLDQPLFDGAGVTKRDLVDYLDRVQDRILPALRDRPLSVIRVTRGQAPFMQKNVPKYTPEWVATVPIWAEASKRTVTYALCNDHRTLLWFANQRAIEYHPTLARVDRLDRATHLVLDLDPPDADAFAKAVAAARLVRQALDDAGLVGAVKSSGAKGVHVFVPIDPQTTTMEDATAATRAIARRAELIDPQTATTAFLKADRQGRSSSTGPAPAEPPSSRPTAREPGPAYRCRSRSRGTSSTTSRPPTSRSSPPSSGWAIAIRGPNRFLPPSEIPAELITEGHEIPTPRVAAMHEGKRRARANRGRGV